MRVTNTSEFMVPYGRRVHLHKSASFQTTIEQLLTNDKIYTNNDLKMND